MADASYFEKSKNGHISGTVCLIGKKFGTMMHIDSLSRISILNFKKFKVTYGRHL